MIMTMPSTLRALLLAFATAVAFSAPALAQNGGFVARPYTVTADQAQRIIAERVLQESLADSLQQLHASLDLTDRQERRWRDFLDTSFSAPSASAAAALKPDAGPLERADAKMAAYREAYDHQRRAVAAMKALYGALSEDQRRRLDDGLDGLSSTVIIPAG